MAIISSAYLGNVKTFSFFNFKSTSNAITTFFHRIVQDPFMGIDLAWKRFQARLSPAVVERHQLRMQFHAAQTIELKIKVLLSAFESQHFYSFFPILLQMVNSLQTKEQDQILQQALFNLISKGKLTEAIKCMDLISCTQLKLSISSIPSSSFKDTLTTAKTLLATASFRTQSNSFISEALYELHRLSRRALNMLHTIINTLHQAVKVIENGKLPESWYETMNMLGVYIALLTALYQLYQLLNVYFVTVIATSLACLSVVAAGVIALNCYYKWFRPLPQSLPGCINESEAAHDKMSIAPIYRKEMRKLKINLQASGLGSKKIVLLRGPSGSGKSSFASALAHEIARGKWPHFQNMVVHTINATQLLESPTGYGKTHLTLITEALDDKVDQVFLYVNELQAIFKNSSNPGLPDRFKTLLEGSQANLRYIIATITAEDWKQYFESPTATSKVDEALKNRFEIIDIPPTDEKTTLQILCKIRENKAPEIPITKKVYEKIIALSNNFDNKEAQPRRSVDFFTKALSAFKDNLDNPSFAVKEEEELAQLKEDLRETRTVLQLQDSDEAVFPTSTAADQVQIDYLANIKTLEKKIKDVKREIKKQRQEIAYFQQLRTWQKQLQQKLIEMAQKMTQKSNHPIITSLEHKFLFTQHYLLRQIANVIDSMAEKYKIVTRLDEQFIIKTFEDLTKTKKDNS